MKGRERVESALKLEVPDRVPVMSGMDALVAKAAGKTVQKYYSDAETYADVAMSAWKILGFDEIFAWWPHILPEAMGAKLSYQEDDYPTIKAPIIRTMDDVEKLRIPDPYKDGKLPLVLEAMRILDDKVGDQVCLCGATYGPYTEIGNLMGFERLLIETMKGSEMVKKLSKKLIDAKTRFGQAMVEAGCQLIWMSEPMASPPILPVGTYEEIVLPPWIELTRALKSAGAYVCWHPCARTNGEGAILEQLLRGNADMISFSETVNLHNVKRMFAHKKCVAGNIDPVMVGQATTERIEQEVKSIIEDAASEGGFVFTPGCSIPLNTPIRNVEAMINSVHRYGWYL